MSMMQEEHFEKLSLQKFLLELAGPRLVEKLRKRRWFLQQVTSCNFSSHIRIVSDPVHSSARMHPKDLINSAECV